MIASAGDPVIVMGQYLGVLIMGLGLVLGGCVAACFGWRDRRTVRTHEARQARQARAEQARTDRWGWMDDKGAA